MKVFIDDGSTNIKMAWINAEGQQQNFVSPNSFKAEWSAPFGVALPDNYVLDAVKYSFDPLSCSAIRTTDTLYQYSDINVIAIHHALHSSGIKPQLLDIEVTLPLSEYFDSDSQPNSVNIERKKNNVMRQVSHQHKPAFEINSVRVMPESIPAGVVELAKLDPMESLLIVDLGGTTLDIAQVRGQMAGITKVFCDPSVGVTMMTDTVMAIMATCGIRTSPLVANTFIEKRHDSEWLHQRIQEETHYQALMDAIQEKEATLKQRILRALAGFSGYSRVLVVGGGAEIIAPTIVKACEKICPVITTQSPQFDLVNGMLTLGV
ncbi:recombinase [Plesiomonas shigelloides]|uniref:plasmid segregation protein ParM domain-containing protein n=1 Tax=Plesiomonas shigelloides TaxID=703 RepID=UPI001261E0BF|nr:plasmid segregation protein ParM domain-containing protein [Plesiomonas shigelloides]KAB7715722.1 recombinase [Plesiomonas shigelloides]